MALDNNLSIIADDVARVEETLHKLNPFMIMWKAQNYGRGDDYEANHMYEDLMRTDRDELFEDGVKFYTGKNGRTINKGLAITFFAMAGYGGHAPAMVNVGMMFLNGEGIEVNYAEAYYWFAQAANRGNERGLYFLADFYMTGRGVVEVNHETALKLYELSAERGSLAAMYNLGVLKVNGDGVAADVKGGIVWISRSAEGGYEPAIQALHKLGTFYDVAGIYEQEKMREREVSLGNEESSIYDLTSAYYHLSVRDKKYLDQYYAYLAEDLEKVLSSTKQATDQVWESVKDGGESDFDLEGLLKKNQKYAAGTIAHMITLLHFALLHSQFMQENSKISEDECDERLEKEIEAMLDRLGEELWENVWEYLVIDMEEFLPACSRNYEDNIENTIRSIRVDFPDFMTD